MAAGIGLQALRKAISHFGRSSIKAGWSLGISVNPCGAPVWPHVRCGGGRVVSVQLSNLGILVSKLPDELAEMDYLMHLDLSLNT